jgi:hypothetical protein
MEVRVVSSFVSMCRASQAWVAIAGGLMLIPSAVHAAAYTFTDVLNPGDPAFTQLLGINNSDTIAGYFGDGAVVPNNGFRLTLPNNFHQRTFRARRRLRWWASIAPETPWDSTSMAPA